MSNERGNKKKRGNRGIDESWLLPYADMLTLLLALFIVLFAMSEVDVKKFKDLAQIFETEFAEGGGICDESSSGVPDDVPMKEEDDKDEDTDDAKALEEYQQLKKMQEEMEGYIEENSLADTLGTALTAEGLLV